MIVHTTCGLLIAGLILFANPAYAETALETCVNDHHRCTSTCFETGSKGSQAACVAKCAASEAQCAGEIGLKTGEPFIREKVEELEGFMKRFFEDVIPLPKEDPAPKKEVLSSTDT
ncbi:hypothetical protein RYZ26_01910 [Terasakiella sp. A23]|uniref:hypothetical protein n=1 Tax=Terasakiella sp. FCG-A23 TaxID=3080561 RepID=UPI002954778E|nr:hypothetical protein [Terasakiella sp. A23]MDV7338333.1 hypothetical protein [Terasakiella sp. A23]